MDENRASVNEYSQFEAIAFRKAMRMRYPPEKEDSADILFNTVENVLAMLLVEVKEQVKPKVLMRNISKNVLLKAKHFEACVEEHKKAQSGADTKNLLEERIELPKG